MKAGTNHDLAAAGQGALTQLRAFLSQKNFAPNDRLPPERSLCETLGVTRTALRNALATLEKEGEISRFVGRGTFVAPRLDAETDVREIAERTSPLAVMEARLAFEPEVARIAALHATADDLEEMEHCIRKTRTARQWRVYETWDNRLHRAIAVATHNPVLLSLFDTLNTVRRAVVWGRLRAARTMDASHHSLREHELIVGAIRERDVEAAAGHMHDHLAAVRLHLMETRRNVNNKRLSDPT